MRARQRHLNKSLREASCAFDARFLSGFADGAAVDTWTDISSNARNATQSTAANRPLYKTGIQASNPVVRFDGTNDNLQTGTFASSTGVTAIMVAKAAAWNPVSAYRMIASHGSGIAPGGTTGIILCVLAQSSAADWLQNDYLGWGKGFDTASPPRTIGPASSGSDWRIISIKLGSSSGLFANGVRASTRVQLTGTPASITRAFSVGSSVAPGDYWDGDIGCVIYYNTFLGDPMRVRLERSNALSFKIACS
jgi:hypothetical protein